MYLNENLFSHERVRKKLRSAFQNILKVEHVAIKDAQKPCTVVSDECSLS